MEKSQASEIHVLLTGIDLLLATLFDVYPFLREGMSILPLLNSIEPVRWVSSRRISEESLSPGYVCSILLVFLAILVPKVGPIVM